MNNNSEQHILSGLGLEFFLLGQRSRCHILSSSIQKKLDLLIDFHQILLDVFFRREASSASYGDLTFLCNCRPYKLTHFHEILFVFLAWSITLHTVK